MIKPEQARGARNQTPDRKSAHDAAGQVKTSNADLMRESEWQRPYQDSPGPDTLAQTPDPFEPERKGSPGKVPVEPPAEPPNPNPVHIPPATPQPGDLPSSNPDVIGSGAVGEEALNRGRV